MWFVRTLLFAAALTCSCASFAQDKPPIPKEAPPRVPFSAFRMKPILDSQLEKKSGSLVVQDMDKPYKPKGEMHVLKPRVSKPGNPPKIIPLQLPRAKNEQLKKEQASRAEAAPVPLPKPAALADEPQSQDTPARPAGDVGIQAPKPVPLEELVELDRLTAKFVNGIPVPASKPTGRQIVRESDEEATQNILATPSEGVLPRPPVSEGLVNPQNRAQAAADLAAQSMDPIIAAPRPVDPNDVYVPLQKGGATERIRDRRRFGSQERMAGGGTRSRTRLSSLGLPAEMRDLRIGKLDEADGVSPVLLPGHTQIVAAPDTVRMDKRGVPNDVIVFFQENSREMEVGQMDVIQSDVLAILKDRPDLTLEIVGFAEPQKGGNDATGKMSIARALMIRDYLSRQHIDSNRLTVKGEGDNTGIEPRDRVEMYFAQ